jgi:hypothetical protein
VSELTTNNVSELTTNNVSELTPNNVYELTTTNVYELTTNHISELTTDNVIKSNISNVVSPNFSTVYKLDVGNVSKPNISTVVMSNEVSQGICDEVSQVTPDNNKEVISINEIINNNYNDTEMSPKANSDQDELDSDDDTGDMMDSGSRDIIPGRLVNIVREHRTDAFMRILVTVHGCEYPALIDTGASHSLLSESVVQKLSLNVLSSKVRLKAVGVTDVTVKGSVVIDVSVSKIKFKSLEFAVMDGKYEMITPIVLGCDFLYAHDVEICMAKRSLRMNMIRDSHIYLTFHEDGRIKNKIVYNLTGVPKNLNEGNYTPRLEVPCVIEEAEASYPVKIDNICSMSNDTAVSQEGDAVLVVANCGESRINAEFTPTHIGMIPSVGEECDIEDARDLLGRKIEGNVWTRYRLESEINLWYLNADQRVKSYDMMESLIDVFSEGNTDIGYAAVTKHKIELLDYEPVYEKARRVSRPIADEIHRQCLELQGMSAIEPAKSAYSSPVVPVKKKDGTIRMCIDYRKLNSKTKPDRHPIPNLLDAVYNLHGTEFFTSLDLVKGYHQIPLDEKSKEYTAFSTSKGHWQWCRLPFGLRNAPAAFQREIMKVLQEFSQRKVTVYIDDILINDVSFDDHLELVRQVLTALKNHNLKIKPQKCSWFKPEVEFLGHIVGRNGIKKLPTYVEAISAFPMPNTVKEMQSFLGVINFQRKFIPGCSEISKPLSNVTGGAPHSKIKWSPEMIRSFETLKDRATSDVELSYPDYSVNATRLELYVDASNLGAGACLVQQQDGNDRVIAYASMSFSDSQRNYSVLDRELAALRWGVKSFRGFLFGVPFVLFTDHQPLVYLHNMKIVCSRLARTVEDLAEYYMEIRYISGKLNMCADTMSRIIKCPDNRVFSRNSEVVLPLGLQVDGSPVEGGGDSLFISLLQVLRGACKNETLPVDDKCLRHILVSELIDHADHYNLKLNRNSRKKLNLSSTLVICYVTKSC